MLLVGRHNVNQTSVPYFRWNDNNSKVYSRLRITWRIDNFTRDYLKKCSECTEIESNPFEIVIGKIKTKWVLLLRPNGDNRRKACLSIFLQKKQESSQNYDYSGRFSIVKYEKEVISWKFNARPAVNDSIGSGYGSLDFLTHNELFQRFNEFVEYSHLKVRADVELSAPKFEGEIFIQSSV